MRSGGRSETHCWLADVLFDHTLVTSALDDVADAATETLRSIAYLGPRAKRHAFVGAGFPLRGGVAQRRYVTISNALDDDGSWKPTSQDVFVFRTRWPGARTEMALFDAGVALERDARWTLRTGLTASYLPAIPTGRWEFVEDVGAWDPDGFDPTRPVCFYLNHEGGDHLRFAPVWVHDRSAFEGFTTDEALSDDDVARMWEQQRGGYGRDAD